VEDWKKGDIDIYKLCLMAKEAYKIHKRISIEICGIFYIGVLIHREDSDNHIDMP